MNIVDNKEQLDNIYEELKVSDSFFLLIPSNPFDNSPLNDISVLFIYLFQYEKIYCLIGTHPDFEFTVNLHTFFNKIETNRHIFIYNKRLFLNTIENKVCNMKANFVDVNMVSYICTNKPLNHIDLQSITNVYRKFLPKYKNKTICGIIPISSHYEYFEIIHSKIKYIYDEYKNYIYDNIELLIVLDEYYTNNFYTFEREGIYVEYHDLKKYNSNVFIRNNLIYSNYEFYTKTGRPTNTFAKLNLLALDKKQGIRNIFKSRFKENGVMYQFDYNSFHLKLISILIEEFNEDIHNYHHMIGKKIDPNLDIENEEDYEKIKGIIFKQIYGGVSKEYMNIDFFRKMTDFSKSLWKDFTTNGYIRTKLFKKKIFKSWFENENMNELLLFNYYIQSFESEFCVYIIKNINDYIIEHELESKLILYTYDSFLFDFNKSEFHPHLENIRNIVTYNDTIPISIKTGSTYQDLKKVKI